MIRLLAVVIPALVVGAAILAVRSAIRVMRELDN